MFGRATITLGIGTHSSSVCFNICHCVIVLFAFVVLVLVFSVVSQELGWEERL